MTFDNLHRRDPRPTFTGRQWAIAIIAALSTVAAIDVAWRELTICDPCEWTSPLPAGLIR